MLSCNFHVYGIFTAILTQTAESFVLLTANLDDVKNLVSHFVSEAAADSLTDYVKETVDKLLDQSKGSQDSTTREHNRGGSGIHFKHKYDLDEEVIKPKQADKNFNIKTHRQKNKSKTSRKTKSTTKFEDLSEVSKREERPNSHKSRKHKPFIREPTPIKPSQYLNNDKSFLDQKKQLIQSQDFKIPVKSTIGYAEQFLLEDEDKEFENSNIFGHKLVSNSGELKESDNVKKPMSVSEFLKDLQRAVDGTTPKEKNEFDQYDNTNYPKELLATSGPIDLPKMSVPKVPREPWWGDEVGLTTKNKSWF